MGNIPAVNALKRIVILEHPQMVFLFETRLKAFEMDKIKQKLKMKNMVVVDCVGEVRSRSGG